MHRRRQPFYSLAVAGALALLPGIASAQDVSLFSTSAIPPNVMLVFDTSGSINHVNTPAGFDPLVFHNRNPDGSPSPSTACSIGAVPELEDTEGVCPGSRDPSGLCPNVEVQDNSGSKSEAEPGDSFDCPSALLPGGCGAWPAGLCTVSGGTIDFELPEVVGSENARWTRNYLHWYVNTAAASTGDLFAIPFSSRLRDAQDALVAVVEQVNPDDGAGGYIENVRFGLAQLHTNNGAFVIVPISTGNKSQILTAIEGFGLDPAEGWTPLSEALVDIGRYFVGEHGQLGDYPPYNRNTTSGAATLSPPPSPIDLACRQNFVVFITDGEPTEDLNNHHGAAFANTIGDFDADGNDAVTGPVGRSDYLDDVAAYLAQQDLIDDAVMPGPQHVFTYTIGFNADFPLLQETALNGRGEYSTAADAAQLAAFLISTLSSIIERATTFTAAAVPASRATDGNNLFTSYFVPSQDDPYWSGHMKLFEFNKLGEIRDAPVPPATQGVCALDDPLAPARCAVGPLDLDLDGFWDAANEVPDAAAGVAGRKLYVSKYQGGPPAPLPTAPLPFTYTPAGDRVTAADLGITGATAADIASYALPLPDFDVAGIITDEQLADAIVKYLRGCEFRDGVCVDRGDGRKLGDIFHSNPVVVGPPNGGIREASYREFTLRYAHRKRVLYAGSNGGFLHGFNAGEFGTLALPDDYDRGTGAEEFGFMAYSVRQRAAEMPKNRAPDRFQTMDGSPNAADVWLYAHEGDVSAPGPLGSPGDASRWNDWRTVLIGGLRAGGRTVWALDVTNPPDHDSPSGAQASGPGYPGYLWEFPCEAAACNAWRPFMGETWSEPIITRVKMTVDCTGTCPTYDRWVAIFGAGYDPHGDPNKTHESNPLDLQASEYDATVASTTKPAGRAIFMVDITTGEVLAAKRFQHDGVAGDPSNGEPGMRYGFAASPAVFDLNHDGYADVIYAADLGGKIWKWVIHEPGEDHLNGTQGSDQQARWPFVELFSAGGCPSCTPPHFKSFFAAPTGAMVGPALWLAIGSGERNDLDFGRAGGPEVPLDPAELNRYYVFKDLDPFERERDPATLPLTDVGVGADLVDVSAVVGINPNTCLTGGALGYFIVGQEGEKFISESTIFFGTVLTGSYVPSSLLANVCDAAGDAFLYGFKLLCGEDALPDPGGSPGHVRRVSIGTGLPNSPRVSVGPLDGGGGGGGPCADMVLVISSDGNAFSTCPGGRPNTGLVLRSWRDL